MTRSSAIVGGHLLVLKEREATLHRLDGNRGERRADAPAGEPLARFLEARAQLSWQRDRGLDAHVIASGWRSP
jgi:hypothetical protein